MQHIRGCDASAQRGAHPRNRWKIAREVGLSVARFDSVSWMKWGASVLASGLLGACTVDPAGYGGDCARSTECEIGLVCIAGACTDDLSAIEDPGAVPELAEPDAGAVVMDGAMPASDAAMPAGDASAPVDPSMTLDASAPIDASMPAVDAG